MEGFKLAKQGAEARLYIGNYLGKPTIAKERFVKKYRNESLDMYLTKERMKAETRAIIRCKGCGIKTPTIYLADFKRRIIFMEYFEHGITVKDYIEKLSAEKVNNLSLDIGRMLGKMHESNIIHGDLTTSNILLANKNNVNDFESFDDLYLVLIDFGLSHVESNTEDKGVDLYVLERALCCSHSVGDKIFQNILEGYQESFQEGYKEVFAKYEEVRARGRKRTMVG